MAAKVLLQARELSYLIFSYKLILHANLSYPIIIFVKIEKDIYNLIRLMKSVVLEYSRCCKAPFDEIYSVGS